MFFRKRQGMPIPIQIEATDQTTIDGTGSSSVSFRFTWTTPGIKTIMVTADSGSDTVEEDVHGRDHRRQWFRRWRQGLSAGDRALGERRGDA